MWQLTVTSKTNSICDAAKLQIDNYISIIWNGPITRLLNHYTRHTVHNWNLKQLGRK